MFLSKKYNVLFIAIPKTGTVSVHAALQKVDPKGERHQITLQDRIIKGKDMEKGVLGHARARELKKILGSEKYNQFHTFAFLRNPYAKLVSSYFFNKKNKLSQAFGIQGKNKIKRTVNTFLTIFIAKVFPFQLWAFIYPYRSNISYVMDYDGKLIVKHLGRTEFLNEDFHKIMEKLNIPAGHVQIGQKNTSSHNSFESYFKSKWFKKQMYKKMKQDIDLYNKICETLD